MSDAPAVAVEQSPVEKDIESLKARVKQLPAHDALRGVVLDYLIPVLEGQREEYVSGFEVLSEGVEQATALAEDTGFDPKFLMRVMQSIIAMGGVLDQTLKLAGWAGADGAPVAACPDEVKISFGAAQALVTSLSAEIKEMQTDDDDDDGTDGDAAAG